MFGFSVTPTAITLTVVLAVIALAYLLVGWLRKRSWRVLLRGLGFMMIPVGLLSMGLMNKIVDGLNVVVDWAKTTVMNGWIMLGLIIAGIGLVAYLAGSFWPPVTGEEAATRRKAMQDRRLAALQASAQAAAAKPTPKPSAPEPGSIPAGLAPAPAPALTSPIAPSLPTDPGPSVPPTAPPPAPTPTVMTDEDKEIDEILRRHGIN